MAMRSKAPPSMGDKESAREDRSENHEEPKASPDPSKASTPENLKTTF
jgi:hypothetical protein